MMKWNMHEWREALIVAPKRQTLPIMTYPGLSLINRNVRDVVTNGRNQFLCLEALARRYPTAATTLMMDLSVEAEAFGSGIRYSDHEVPTVIGSLITPADSADLTVPAVGSGRTGIFLDAARLASERLPDRPVLAGGIGPFSLAGRLMDLGEIFVAMLEEAESVHGVLAKVTQFIIEYSREFKTQGANGIIIAEPTAGLLSPDQCAAFSSCYVKQIVDAVQDQNFCVLLHNCGNTLKLVDVMVATGAQGLHFGNAVRLTAIMPQIPGDRIVLGNIDPAGVLKNGSEQEVADQVTALLKAMQPYSNFVLSSGCDIPPGTPLANIDSFFQALQDFNETYRPEVNLLEN